MNYYFIKTCLLNCSSYLNKISDLFDIKLYTLSNYTQTNIYKN